MGKVGEAKKKKRAHAIVLETETRCIYCASPATTIEHMPPKTLFDNKYRPKGMEFAACAACNNGTRGADVVVSFFAHIDMDSGPDQSGDFERRLRDVRRYAPGVIEELNAPGKMEHIFLNRKGVLRPMVQVKADGPITKGYVRAFAAKFAMALYRQHIGVPLPLEGGIQIKTFNNVGVTEELLRNTVKLLPMRNKLSQGKIDTARQFSYVFQTDQKSIVAAFASLRGNAWIFATATSTPSAFGFPWPQGPAEDYCQPGQLLSLVPSRLRKIPLLGR